MGDVFRFAPSPNGDLHLGHAYSACLNFDMARASGGRLLLRMEDIDPARCRPEYEIDIKDDLAWLGLSWEEPVRRQSEHVETYRKALEELIERGLVYPAFLSRSEVKRRVEECEREGLAWPRDPDGTPLYPLDERDADPDEAKRRIASGERHLWRLNMARAVTSLKGMPLGWSEEGAGKVERIVADPEAWGDVVLWRWDAPASYHLAVVIDDALQGVTKIVRGMDLYWSTPIHRLLQTLLDLPEPHYHHHRLILDETGAKLSKSLRSTGLRMLREDGASASDIRLRLGLGLDIIG